MESGKARIESVLREREATGLRVPAIVRLFFGVLTGALLIGVQSPLSGALRAAMAAVWVVWLAPNFLFLRLLKRRQHIVAVGTASALLDVVFMGGQMVAAELMIPLLGLPPGALFRSQAVMFGLVLVLINALALRPRYPLIAGAGMWLSMGVALWRASQHEAFILSDDPEEVFLRGAQSPGELVNMFVIFAAGTATIAAVTHVARKTVRAGIVQEFANAQLQQEQLEVVMREKMVALGKLVAGVSHELNSPLGVLKSSLDTQGKALGKLGGGANEKDRRWIAVALESSASSSEAFDRIHATAESLRSFAHLDEAERKPVSLKRQIGLVLERVAIPDGKNITIERHVDEVPEVHGSPRELSQALATLVENAFDAIDDAGTVTITLAERDGELALAIRDTGRGIGEDKREALFDVGLSSDDTRVAARFGLATAQSVALRHGGRISVDSEVGVGSTFTLHLPLADRVRGD